MVKFTNFHKYHCKQDAETGGTENYFCNTFINLKLFQEKKLIFFLRILNGGTKIDLEKVIKLPNVTSENSELIHHTLKERFHLVPQ